MSRSMRKNLSLNYLVNKYPFIECLLCGQVGNYREQGRSLRFKLYPSWGYSSVVEHLLSMSLSPGFNYQ
jgi:hypothetical protein